MVDLTEMKELSVQDDRYVLKSWSRKPNAPIIVGGERIYFWDAEGRRFMDFSSQLVNVNIGHGHQKVVKAIQKQVEELAYVSGVYRSIPVIKLAKRLAEITPGDLRKSFFTCGGGAAVESAMKIAKQYTGRPKIVSMWRGYHGSTFGALSATGITKIRTPFEPLLQGFVHVPPPYCYRCSFGLRYPDCGVECARFVERVFRWEDPEMIAAFVAEPILANVFVVPPKEYWPMVQEICDKHGILLIFDEVITGFGRTGKMFGCEHFNVVPDILVAGKGITSGYLPLGVAIVSEKVGEFFDENPLSHGFTYTAHPTCCAAGLAEMDVLLEENLVENASEVGAHLMLRLKELEGRHKCVGDVRGLGLLMGFELVKDRKTKELLGTHVTEQDIIVYVREKANERGLEVGISSSFAPSIVRVVPPLCVTKDEVDLAVTILDEVLHDVDSKL